jgi:hypothetical protein
MIFDNFDAAMLAATPLLLPNAEASEALETGSGPTLDDALREFESVDRAPDLWVTDAMRGTASPVTVEEVGDNGTASAEPSEEEAIDAPSPQADANAPLADPNVAQDHPLLKEKLSFAEMGGHMIARQYDSTDYSWEEMSSGDYDWALGNFKADVYAAVLEFTAGATSRPQADQMGQAYLNSIGLGSLVHVNGSVTGTNDLITVTASTTIYHQPINYMPILSLDQPGLDNFDPHTIYDILDVSAHTIAIEVDTPLTPQQLEAVEQLRVRIGLTTEMLNALPANGLFTFPDGKTVTVAELRQLWARADFVITNNSYADNGIPGTPGAGAAIRNNGDPVFEINVDYLTNSAMVHDWTAFFYVLHELAHVTLAGDASFWSMYADGVRTDDEFRRNEAFATSLAIAIGAAADYQWLSVLTTGYQNALQLVPPPTFSVPGSGGGGGGPGGGGEVGGQ